MMLLPSLACDARPGGIFEVSRWHRAQIARVDFADRTLSANLSTHALIPALKSMSPLAATPTPSG
jgi:hypothetical protein